MATFTHEIVIAKPIDEVFAAVANVQQHGQWQEGLLRSEISPGQSGAGAMGTETRRMFGREMQFPCRITRYNPPTEWGFEVTSGPMRPSAVLRFSSVPTGTQIKSELNVPGLLGSLMGNMMLAQQKRNYIRLKELVEAGKL